MKKRILIIDPDIQSTLRLKDELQSSPAYELRAVTRLTAATQALQEHSYRLVVMDLQMERVLPIQVVGTLRNVQPSLPILISSRHAEDAAKVDELRAQGFLQKPYDSAALIEAVEAALSQPLNAHDAVTRANPSLDPALVEDYEAQAQLDPLLQISQQQQHAVRGYEDSPPPDATLREVLNAARDPDVSQRIQIYRDPAPIPDDPTIPLQLQGRLPEPPTLPEEATLSAGDSLPAAAVLSAAADEHTVNLLLDEVQGKSEKKLTVEPGFLRELINSLPPPTLVARRPQLDPVPSDQDTDYAALPRPPRLPDQEWIDQLEDAASHTEEVPPPPTPAPPLSPPLPDDSEPLMPVSVQEMTQQLEALEAEDLEKEQAALQVEADAEAEISERLLAHYVLEMTRFAMESSVQALLLSRGGEVLARAGELSREAWASMEQWAQEAWAVEDDAPSRLIYRRLPQGEVLLYSIQTVEAQVLSFLFKAETSMRLIHQQARHLLAALESVASAPADAAIAPPAGPDAAPAPAPVTQQISPYAAAEDTGDVLTPTPPPREPGSYTSYACLWLLHQAAAPLHDQQRSSLTAELRRICITQGWDFKAVESHALWMAVSVEVPSRTLPNEIAALLMEQSAAFLHQHDPSRADQPLWSDGYLIRTPASTLTTNTINRFIQFQRSAAGPQ